MLIVSRNLSALVEATDLCPAALTEEFSLRLRLGKTIRRMRPEIGTALRFGGTVEPADCFFDEETIDRDLALDPGDCVLACSADPYRMPDSYFGFVQTKGTLARLFVSATCADGQVEPGFHGRITLELVNHGRIPLRIPVEETIAQVFVFRCSTAADRPYEGRYQGAVGPTLPTFILRTVTNP